MCVYAMKELDWWLWYKQTKREQTKIVMNSGKINNYPDILVSVISAHNQISLTSMNWGCEFKPQSDLILYTRYSILFLPLI